MTENSSNYHLLVVAVGAFCFAIAFLLFAWATSTNFTDSNPRGAALLFFSLGISCLVGLSYVCVSVRSLLKSGEQQSRSYGGLIASSVLMLLGMMLALLTLNYLMENLFSNLNEEVLLSLAISSLLLWWIGIYFLTAWLFENTPLRTGPEILFVAFLSIQAIFGIVSTFCVVFVR